MERRAHRAVHDAVDRMAARSHTSQSGMPRAPREGGVCVEMPDDCRVVLQRPANSLQRHPELSHRRQGLAGQTSRASEEAPCVQLTWIFRT